ncbi:WhiB family transcriptional regulator [Saccharopolyspora shandongensis]|uniref:WhiB family transcriptional regulator n=1 Tax=Saccharopolyspora shandongensis TaxID=418495 RepID=UPI0033C769A7
MEAQDWRDDAPCRDEDPDLFAPATYHGLGALQAKEAKAICADCPVAAECLADAIAQVDDTTVRGGMTPEERRAWRRPDLQPAMGEWWVNGRRAKAVA